METVNWLSKAAFKEELFDNGNGGDNTETEVESNSEFDPIANDSDTWVARALFSLALSFLTISWSPFTLIVFNHNDPLHII